MKYYYIGDSSRNALWHTLKKCLYPAILLAFSIAIYTKVLFSKDYNTLTDTTPLEIDFSEDLQTKIFHPNISKCTLDFIKHENRQEKFLTYLPHSGFHNQRISLTNAIFLAWYTNRTLILPPTILGRKIPWSPNAALMSSLARFKAHKDSSDCDDSNDFDDSDDLVENSKEKCLRFTASYTLLRWDEILDMEYIERYVRIRNREDFSSTNLYTMLNITNPQTEIYYPTEATRYDYQFFDESTPNDSVTPFSRRASLCSLRERKEKLIHFYSVYSSKRLTLNLWGNKRFKETVIDRHLVFGNPVLLDVANEITKKLGGSGQYVGIHLRAGDHGYKKYKKETIQILIEAMEKDEILSETNSEIYGSEMSFSKCASSNNQKIYLATDIEKHDKALIPFFSKYPCTFILKNFTDQLSPLKKMINSRDGTNLYNHFIPMVDLVIAAKGGKFYGTNGSTFSYYAQHLHQLWTIEDPGQLIDIGHRY
ncbi:hypothetical protein G9A89_008921 [Geosiphon pyriformis]|nr:hypothetical protein G9A89_008921 [Geosiphon pyriformis]